jgi:hypothetical protein
MCARVCRSVFLALTLALAIAMLQTPSAKAASIRKVTPVEYLDCDYRLEGDFRSGDEVAIIAGLRAAQSGGVICLHSNGGVLATALDIAEFIVGEAITGSRNYITMVRKGDSCLSACAVLFMSGNMNELTTYPLRRIEAGGRVCFHQPFFEPDEGRTYTASDLKLVAKETVGQVNRIIKLTNRFYEVNFVNWWEDPVFPSVLLKDMLATLPGDLLCVETIQQFARYGIEPVVSVEGQIMEIGARGIPDGPAQHAVNACRNYLKAFFPEGFFDTSRTLYGSGVSTGTIEGRVVYEVGGFNNTGASYGGFPCYVSGIEMMQPRAWLSLEGEVDKRPWYEREGEAVFLRSWYVFAPEQRVSLIDTVGAAAHSVQDAAEMDGELRPGEWLVIMGSGSSRAEIEARSRRASVIPGARVVRTDEFSNLRSGLFALVSGPWDKADAQALAEVAKRSIPDSYIKKAYR